MGHYWPKCAHFWVIFWVITGPFLLLYYGPNVIRATALNINNAYNIMGYIRNTHLPGIPQDRVNPYIGSL